MRGAELSKAFKQADRLLNNYQQLWRIQPMSALAGADTTNPYQSLVSILQAAMPDNTATAVRLAEAVGALSLQQIEAIDGSIGGQHTFFSPLLPDALALDWLTQPAIDPQLPASHSLPFWLTNGIGGRKLSQITAFIAHVPPVSGELVEWCAGKGHLGRLLSYVNQVQDSQAGERSLPAGGAHSTSLSITSLEWQPELCASGAVLAQQFGLAQRFQQTDVLSSAGGNAIAQCEHAVALHACGDLHLTLLEQATQTPLHNVWLAPCCYHLTTQSHYRPLSQAADQSLLSLTRQELKLAVQGQVTAGERVRHLRQTEVTWRLAYQLLREQHANASQYRALPSVPKHWFSGRFEAFAEWACAEHEWTLPQQIDWQALLSKAEQRYLLLKRLDLIRHVFRRPLELWLVLDRALFLQEHHYEVAIQAFCDYQMTPRNLLISARRYSA
ncbi:MAG: methyltransferase [Idiomarina sp.]|nr:methyltransferase [Idiomarina sp.]